MSQNPASTSRGQLGRGRGRGRSRGRGGKSGKKGGGRRAADVAASNQRASTEEKQETKASQITRSESLQNTYSEVDWVVEALTALGCPSPREWKGAALTTDDAADEQLQRLTVWLEDRCVRLWNFQDREKLKHDFWNTIDHYLKELDCPPGYISSELRPPQDTESSHWRTDKCLRVRVVNWLLACATSEMYGDTFLHANPESQDSKTGPDATRQQVPPGGDNQGPKPFSKDRFPLGFSTGDNQVDEALVLIRMRLLYDLETTQRAINTVIAEQQLTSARRSKPLKQYRPRSNTSR